MAFILVAGLLPVAAGSLQNNGEDAGLISGQLQGDVVVDGDFSLDKLLSGGVDICGVGEGDVRA